MNFIYVENGNTKVENIAKLQAILSNENVILDTKYLPIMEQAEQCDFNSIAEMATIFTDGVEGTKPNYNLAKRYTIKGLEIVKESGDAASILEIMTNLALVEARFDNIDKSKEILKEGFDLVISEFPLEETLGNISNLFHFFVNELEDK